MFNFLGLLAVECLAFLMSLKENLVALIPQKLGLHTKIRLQCLCPGYWLHTSTLSVALRTSASPSSTASITSVKVTSVRRTMRCTYATILSHRYWHNYNVYVSILYPRRIYRLLSSMTNITISRFKIKMLLVYLGLLERHAAVFYLVARRLRAVRPQFCSIHQHLSEVGLCLIRLSCYPETPISTWLVVRSRTFVLWSRWRDRRQEIYANIPRAPDAEAASSYYDYMSVYIDALRTHQYRLRDDIL